MPRFPMCSLAVEVYLNNFTARAKPKGALLIYRLSPIASCGERAQVQS